MNLRQKKPLKKNRIIKVRHDDVQGVKKLTAAVASVLPNDETRKLVIVCIGTDRSTGDALGPIAGSKLARLHGPRLAVHGTLDSPVHAINLETTLEEIQQSYKDPFIIGIDASLGKQQSVGMISFADGPVKPGAGVKKQLPPVGDAHLTGIVNICGYMEYFVLQNTRLNLVMSMAETIADSVYAAYRRQSSPFSLKTTYK
ncbi:MAG TPA: spore protease YyaC [Bacillales bacterium]|nr:spore protease YyaC [Bacillales bacterium]